MTAHRFLNGERLRKHSAALHRARGRSLAEVLTELGYTYRITVAGWVVRHEELQFGVVHGNEADTWAWLSNQLEE